MGPGIVFSDQYYSSMKAPVRTESVRSQDVIELENYRPRPSGSIDGVLMAGGGGRLVRSSSIECEFPYVKFYPSKKL